MQSTESRTIHGKGIIICQTDTGRSMTETTARVSKTPAIFRALRHYNYRVWFIGQGISLIGTWMQTVAQQVLIYRLTGSALALGTVNLIGLIPVIPLSLWSGSLSDRFPKRAVILTCQYIMLAQALLMAVLIWTDTIRVWHIYILALILAAANAVDLPARQAFTVDLVEGKADLTNAIGLNSAMFNTARALGPALAGILVAATGEGTAFFINGLTFVSVIVCLFMMRNLPGPQPGQMRVNTSAHLMEGLKYTLKQRVILILTSLVGVSAFLSMPYNTLMPVFATDVLGESAAPVIRAICSGADGVSRCTTPEALPQGLLLAAMGAGATLGALLVASLSDHAPRGRLLTLGNLGFPIVLLFFALSRSFTLSMILMVLVGINFVWQNALANTLLQLSVPDNMRGRVMSIYTLTFQVMMRAGGFQAGLVADWMGAPFSIGIGAAISLLYGAGVAIFYPKIRRL